jgi:hypothetical protein
MTPPSPPIYRRLSGRGFKSGGSLFAVTRTRCRLWLAEDHLLQVETEFGMVEAYKRFYFRDLQAVIIQPTRDRWFGGIIFGVVIGALLLMAWGMNDVAGRITFLIIAGIFAVLALAQQLLGRDCVCHFKTAVQLEQVPSLKRQRQVRKFLTRLRPLLGQAQGELTGEQRAANYAEVLARVSAVPGTAGAVVGRILTPLVPYQSRVHYWLFLLLGADAVVAGLNLFWQHLLVITVSALLGLLYLGLTVLALVKQSGTDLSAGVRGLTWVVAGYAGIFLLTGYILMLVLVPAQSLDGTQLEFFKALAALDPFETTWWLTLLLVQMLGSALLATVGLLLLNRDPRRRSQLPPVLPA